VGGVGGTPDFRVLLGTVLVQLRRRRKSGLHTSCRAMPSNSSALGSTTIHPRAHARCDDWLAFNHVSDGSVRVNMMIATGLLVVCLVMRLA